CEAADYRGDISAPLGDRLIHSALARFRRGAEAPGEITQTRASAEHRSRGCSSLSVADFLAKADSALQSAKRDLAAGDYDGAANRLYYAMFHAARAALFNAGAS